MDYREQWKGWNELPKAKEGNTGKYPKYQSLLFKLTNELKPKRILEIGFNAGHSACCFLNASPKSEMVTFDQCRWGTEAPALKVLQEHFNISLVNGDSTVSVPKYFEENDTKFDLVFIDGGHINDVPYLDMMNTKDRVNTGGILIVDDMGVGSVTGCYKKVNWDGFEIIPQEEKIEKNIVILRKK